MNFQKENILILISLFFIIFLFCFTFLKPKSIIFPWETKCKEVSYGELHCDRDFDMDKARKIIADNVKETEDKNRFFKLSNNLLKFHVGFSDKTTLLKKNPIIVGYNIENQGENYFIDAKNKSEFSICEITRRDLYKNLENCERLLLTLPTSVSYAELPNFSDEILRFLNDRPFPELKVTAVLPTENDSIDFRKDIRINEKYQLEFVYDNIGLALILFLSLGLFNFLLSLCRNVLYWISKN